MIRKTLPLSIALLALLCAAAVAPAEGGAPTADDIIAKNITARGGADKITAMKSIRMTGTMVPAPGMEMPMKMEWKRPNKIRVEFTMQGMTGIQAFDGETGWQLMPFMGQTAPEKMADKDLEDIRDQADVEGELFNYKEKGHKVEYVGAEEIEGTPTHHLRVTKKNGEVAEVYLETDSNLEIKRKSKREINGQQVDFEVNLGDYKEVGGLMLAHSLQFVVPGMPAGAGSGLTFNSIEINTDVPDDRFAMPAAAPAAPKP